MQYPPTQLQLHVESSRAGSLANAFHLNIQAMTSLTNSSNSSRTNCTVFLWQQTVGHSVLRLLA